MQDRVRNRCDWCAGIYCKNAESDIPGKTRRKAQETEITEKRPCGEAYHQQGRGRALDPAPWAAGRRSGSQKENRPQNIYRCLGRCSYTLYDGKHYRACAFASRASCNTWEKFRFISRAAVLSHAGMVSVFLTDLSKCSFA